LRPPAGDDPARLEGDPRDQVRGPRGRLLRLSEGLGALLEEEGQGLRRVLQAPPRRGAGRRGPRRGLRHGRVRALLLRDAGGAHPGGSEADYGVGGVVTSWVFPAPGWSKARGSWTEPLPRRRRRSLPSSARRRTSGETTGGV